MTGAVASRMAPTAFAWWTSRSTRTKLLIRALVSVAVLMWVSLVLAQPADAVGSLSAGTVDDETVKGFSSDVGNYLVTNRWSPVSFTPSGFLGFGSVATYGAYTIQTILVGAGVFLARIFMGMIYLTSGGDLVMNSADTIDRIFAKVGNGLLGNDGGAMLDGSGIMLIGVLSVILIGVTFWQYVRQGGARRAGQTFLLGFGALMLLVVMSSAAASNAKVTEAAAASAGTGGRGGSTLSASMTLAHGPEPAFASPKWFITRGNVFSAFVGDTTQKIFTSISDSFDASPTSSRDECERYVAAMHATYVERSGPQAATHLIVAFDQLLATTLWDNERAASMGGATESSDAAWCRYSELEASAPMIDQVQLSRKAGLYSDIVGYDASEGLAGDAPSKDGTAVTAAGEWTDGGQELAADVFGPAFASGDSS
ncbi:MAG TPA: hypothetical protein VFC06_02115, partial [Demequina sp.]|nr:hypothetical protein [Demequina sp.]